MHPQLAKDLEIEMQLQEQREMTEMMRSQARQDQSFTPSYLHLRKTWLLRAFQCGRTRRTLDEVLELTPGKQRRLLETLGLIAEGEPLPMDTAEMIAALDRELARWAQQPPLDRTGRPFNHLAALGRELGLTAVEQEIVLFAAMLKGDPLLGRGMDLLGETNRYEVRELLADILDLRREDLQQVFCEDSLLQTSGLVEFEQDTHNPVIRNWLIPMPQLVYIMLDPIADRDSLFRECLRPASPPNCAPPITRIYARNSTC